LISFRFSSPRFSLFFPFHCTPPFMLFNHPFLCALLAIFTCVWQNATLPLFIYGNQPTLLFPFSPECRLPGLILRSAPLGDGCCHFGQFFFRLPSLLLRYFFFLCFWFLSPHFPFPIRPLPKKFFLFAVAPLGPFVLLDLKRPRRPPLSSVLSHPVLSVVFLPADFPGFSEFPYFLW